MVSNLMLVKLNSFVLVYLHLTNVQLLSSYLCGELLVFLNSVCHLGHILTYNLSDNDDIVFKSQDLLERANLLFCNFKFCSPHIYFNVSVSFILSLLVWMLSVAARLPIYEPD